jgi:hypothetical protein
MKTSDLLKFRSIYESRLLAELKLPVVNEKEVTKVLDKYTFQAKNNQISQWFNSVVKNYLISDQNKDNIKIGEKEASEIKDLPDWAKISLEKNQDLYKFNISDKTKEILDRIFDFLQSNDASPLYNKLQKITVNQMLTNEENWLKQIAREGEKRKGLVLDPKNYNLIYRFADGYQVIQLVSAAAKDRRKR